MTKHKDEAPKFDENRPTVPDNKPADPSVLEHNWQPNSPAIDLTEKAVTDGAVNTVAQAKAAEAKKDEKKKVFTQAEYDRRTLLDVTDPEYINPSLDHYDVK